MGAIVTSEFNGMRLTLAREIQNISSPKLAEKIGVTKQTVSQYENGLIKPSADKVLAISQELKFPPKFSLKVAAIILVPELHIVEQLQPRQEP